MVRKVGSTKKRGKSIGKRKPTKRRSRRISGFNTNGLMDLAMNGLEVGAGICAGRLFNTVVVKQFPTFATSPYESAAIQFAGGIALAAFIKNPLVRNIGLGMAGQGLAVAAVQTGIISGIGSDRMSYRVNGINQYKNAIAGSGQTRLIGRAGYNGSAIAGSPGYPAGTMSVISGGGSKCV